MPPPCLPSTLDSLEGLFSTCDGPKVTLLDFNTCRVLWGGHQQQAMVLVPGVRPLAALHSGVFGIKEAQFTSLEGLSTNAACPASGGAHHGGACGAYRRST